MTTDMVARFVGVIPGYVQKRYHWLQNRNCLFAVEDLIQIAMIELIKLNREWDGTVDGRRIPDGDQAEAMFFTKLKWKVAAAIRAHRDGVEPLGDADYRLDQEVGEGTPLIELLDQDRTSLRVKESSFEGKILVHDIVDYYSTLPRRDKVIFTLRYFDELTFREIGTLLDRPENSIATHVSKATPTLRDFARNLVTDHTVDVDHRRGSDWSDPEKLTEYVHGRHRLDVSEWLGLFTICLREDITYLADILGPGHHFTARSKQSVHRQELAKEIDRRLAEGQTQAQISRDLNVARTTVWNHAHRRAA